MSEREWLEQGPRPRDEDVERLERELVEVRRERDELRMLLEGSQIDATEQAQRAERAESRLRAVTRDTYR